MIESLRIFGLLLYKSWLVRKRHYLATVVGEILVPVGLVICIWAVTTSNSTPPKEIQTDSYYRAQSSKELIDLVTDLSSIPAVICYVPNNTFTRELMENVRECFGRKYSIGGFATESEFRAFFYKDTLFHRVGVIFDRWVDHSVKHLSYKIRKSGHTLPLYNDKAKPLNMTEDRILVRHLAQLQLCVDRSFVGMKSGKQPIPEMYIQRVPYPAHTEQIPFDDNLRMSFRNTLMIAFMIPLFIETARSTNEKFIGVNVLMSMNGISNTLNLLSWIVSGFLLLSVFCAIPILILLTYSPVYGLPYMHYGNPLLLYLILIFYLAHLLTFGIHISAYFSKALLVTTALLILNALTVTCHMFAFPDHTLHIVPYVGIIFPNFLFLQSMGEIANYERTAEGIQWYNLFRNANPLTDAGSSVGMILFFSVIGTIFHFLLAIYVYAINPGKYGVGKHPLYFIKRKPKKKENDVIDNLKYDEAGECFEPTPEGVYSPGIQIRKLKKDYKINPFTKERVHALRGISVDFYKGQMTSLLGHNGAGKTTMISILTGMISPTDGIILIDSKDLKENAYEIWQDMGLCTQENMYFASLTLSEQLLLFAMVKKKGKPMSSVEKDVEALLLDLKLSNKKDSLPKTLSGGQKRRLCLGMALVGDSSTLILDEPTSGLDPESRRVIWNLLLKLRGEKTIIISTHDMEEADILGDRIAIMHTGLLKCYGTPLFLKRLIGQNNVEITLSLEARSDPERIRGELHKEGIIVNKETAKMVVKIPNSPSLPDTLDNLEKKKKELGVSGFSVSLISLEQVFLKMTQEDIGPPKPRQPAGSEEVKLRGRALCFQIVRALLSKKLIYAVKDYRTILIKIFTIFMALLIDAVVLHGIIIITKHKEDLVHINLNMYHQPDVLYKSYNSSLGYRYKTVSKNQGGNPIEVTDSSFENALLARARENLVFYDNYLIAAAEFNETSATAFYSEMAAYSLPISINLLWNTIIQNIMGPGYSVTLFSQELPFEMLMYLDLKDSFGYATALSFAIIFCLTIGMFAVHPNRETARGVKQLQTMTGVSSLTYWGTMFIYDLFEYAFFIVLVVAGFAGIDLYLGLRLFGANEILVEILLLLLFGINALPFIYIFSFLQMKTSAVVRLAMYVPVVIVTLDLIMSILMDVFAEDDTMKSFRVIQKMICLLLPCVSFAHSEISFFMTAHTNGRCCRLSNDFYDKLCKDPETKDICCDMDCYDGECKKPKPFFDDAEEDVSLVVGVTCLCLTPMLYFGILTVIENRCIQKWMIKNVKKKKTVEHNTDEQVQQEKSMIFERIQTLSGKRPISINNGTSSNETAQPTGNSYENHVFLVYELRKSFKTLKAVEDVSFGVNRQECFGFLGVNGAGKSTTFRMMTGAIIPDHGIMYIGDKRFKKNRKYFLAQMGYVPQHDAILKRLNSYDHLRLFARLRGIPEKQVENEVQAWIDRMNLNACASQPTGTYSGGNKRRLNIAIALIGNPNLILMDEPTTGVDPGARRSLWNVIKACQMAGQAVVLTSHSMEECEALCDRLAIMVDGKLVCIGASEELKQRFGAGYDIQIRMDPERARDQVNSIKNEITQSLHCVLTDENLGYLMYHVSPLGTTWRKMYNVMNEAKKKNDCIEDFSILSSSLEQLFLLFAKANSRSSSYSN